MKMIGFPSGAPGLNFMFLGVGGRDPGSWRLLDCILGSQAGFEGSSRFLGWILGFGRLLGYIRFPNCFFWCLAAPGLDSVFLGAAGRDLGSWRLLGCIVGFLRRPSDASHTQEK